MGVGPEGVAAALEEISEENISLLRDRMGEMGLVAEAALAEKGQHSLSSEPLQSMSERTLFSGASSRMRVPLRESISLAQF